VAGQSFATETVFSHPSKLEIVDAARARGCLVVVMHVGVDGPDLSVGRVMARTEEGGHDVPEEKIRARYERGQPLIRDAVLRADRGMVFDNSRLNAPQQQMLVFAGGRLIKAAPVLPRWILTAYAADLVI
jgi:predicted ABC-type ATPase